MGEPAVNDGDPPSTSVVRTSLARFGAEAISAFLALFTGVVTARNLGPSGKGALSMLSYLIALAVPISVLGLGEAAITLTGRRRFSHQRALSASIAVVLPVALVCAATILLLCRTLLGDVFDSRMTAVVVAGPTLVLAATLALLTSMTDAFDRVVWTSAVRMMTTATTAVATVVLVTFLDFGVSGAMVATTAGAGIATVALVVLLRRLGVVPRPAIDVPYLRAALRIGMPVQLSFVILGAGARIDLFVVNAFEGASAAGSYSVALTLGEMAAYAPFAISIATYPRIARLGTEEEVAAFSARITRLAIVAAAGIALGLLLVVPTIVPLLFGEGFDPAITPAMVLIATSAVWAGQWVLCRARAAAGEPRIVLQSFAASLLTMVALDLVLIPVWGLLGAALASSGGAVVGAAIALRSAQRRWGTPLRTFVPSPSDVVEVVQLVVTPARRYLRRTPS